MMIQLDEQGWRAVLTLLAKGPWEQANPLIMEIGRQMQAQSVQAAPQTAHPRPNGPDPVSQDPPTH
jgi:hypothetical protein